MVEHVIRVGTKSEFDPLCNRDHLQNGEIGVKVARTAEGVSRQVAEIIFALRRQELRRQQATGVRVVAPGIHRSTQEVSRENGARHIVQTTDRRTGAVDHAIGISRVEEERSGERPSTDELIHTRAGRLERQFPNIVRGEVLANVVIGIAVVQTPQAEWVELHQGAIPIAAPVEGQRAAIGYLVKGMRPAVIQAASETLRHAPGHCSNQPVVVGSSSIFPLQPVGEVTFR